MGSHCSKIKHVNVIWPVVVTPEITSPGSLEGLDRMQFEDQSSEKKSCKAKKKQAEIGSKTKEAEEDGIRENNDTNVTRSRISDDSFGRRAFQYKKGPVLESDNPFAEVCECLDLIMGERLAVKTYQIVGTIEKMADELELLQDEITVLQDLYHVNLIRYDGMEFYQVKGQKGLLNIDIIMEYASGGSVWGLIQKFSNLEERVVQNYTRQILDGLGYLHSEGVVHGNLKGSNVLIDSNGVIKLTDVQSTNRIKYFSKEAPRDGGGFDVLIDSIYWTAPEVIIERKIEPPADVWSVGCVIIEMLTGLPPWASRGRDEAENRIISGTLPPVPGEITEVCKDFLSKVFRSNPEERPTIPELLEHPFVQSFEKNTENSSLGDSLQTLQSFNSMSKGNPALFKLSTVLQNQADMANDGNARMKPTVNKKANNTQNIKTSCQKETLCPPKAMGGNPKKGNLDIPSKETTHRHILPYVQETNIEEEDTPNERIIRIRHSAQIEKGFQLNSTDGDIQKDGRESGEEGVDKCIRKAKTVEYDENNNNKKEEERENSENLKVQFAKGEEAERGNTFKKPFAPVRVSLFKKIPRGEIELEGDLRYSIKDLDSNKDEQTIPSMSSPDGNQWELTKEQQRKRIEREMMSQLMRINSKDLSQYTPSSSGLPSKREDGFSPDASPGARRKKLEDDMRRQLERINMPDVMTQSELRSDSIHRGEGPKTKEEQRKMYEDEMRRQLESIRTSDLIKLANSRKNEMSRIFSELRSQEFQGQVAENKEGLGSFGLSSLKTEQSLYTEKSMFDSRGSEKSKIL